MSRRVEVYETPSGLVGQFDYEIENGQKTVVITTPAIPLNTQEAVWLRAPSSSGGKDWIYCKTNKGFVTIWGKAWHAKQSKRHESGGHPSGPVLIDSKLRKGYETLARFDGRSWNFEAPVTPGHPLEDSLARSQGVPRSRAPLKSPLESAISDWVGKERDDWF